MGALIGALYAELGNVVRTTQRTREACQVLQYLSLNCCWLYHFNAWCPPKAYAYTAWKVSRYRVFSAPYFPVLDYLLRKSPYSVRIRENADQEKLRNWTLFTQWYLNKPAAFSFRFRYVCIPMRRYVLHKWERIVGHLENWLKGVVGDFYLERGWMSQMENSNVKQNILLQFESWF